MIRVIVEWFLYSLKVLCFMLAGMAVYTNHYFIHIVLVSLGVFIDIVREHYFKKS